MTYTIPNGLRDREYDSYASWDGGSKTSVLVTITSGIDFTIGSVSANVDSIYVQSGTMFLASGIITTVSDVDSSYLTSGTVTTVEDVASSYLTSGTVSDVQSAYIKSGANIQIAGSHAVDAVITVPPVYIGGKAESTVPTEVGDGDAVDYWTDTFGRQIIKGTNLGTESVDVSEVAPWGIQTINTTNLSAVGSSAGSHVGAWVNVSDFREKTLYFVYTSGTTGGMVVRYEASPNAGSDVFVLGSYVYTDTSTNNYTSVTAHHEYMRSRTTVNSGGTLSVYLTGRGN